MSVVAQVAIALGSILALLATMVAVRRLAKTTNLGAEVQRKLIHVATGLYAMSLPWLFPDRWPVYLLILLTFAVMIALRLPAVASGLGQPLHGIQRRSYGDFMLAAAVGLCFILSDGDALIYILPIAVLTLSDAAAAIAGTRWGSRWFQVESGQKSLEGSAVFFVVTLLIALACLFVLADLPTANMLALALMTSAFGTLVEAQSWRGFDNLFLPLALLVFLSEHGHKELAELAMLSALFALSILGFLSLGPRLGLSAHASRVHAVAMFLILAVTAPQNALLPALVLVAHAGASARYPSRDGYAELDVVASLAVLSFGWLAIGNATGWNAVSFYGLSAMGLTMGLSVIAFNGSVAAMLLIGAVLLALRLLVVALNPAASNWAEPLSPLAFLSLLAPATIVGLAPSLFARNRILKLTLLALVLPAAYYLIAVMLGTGAAASRGT